MFQIVLIVSYIIPLHECHLSIRQLRLLKILCFVRQVRDLTGLTIAFLGFTNIDFDILKNQEKDACDGVLFGYEGVNLVLVVGKCALGTTP